MSGDLFALFSLVKNSTTKAILNKKFLIVIIVMFFISAVMGYTAVQGSQSLEECSDLLDIFVISFFLPLMSMIFGSSLIRDEIEDKSITNVLTAPISRPKMFLGYYFSIVIVSAFAVLLILTSGFITYFSISGVDTEAVHIYTGIGRVVALGTLVYSSLFLLVSIIIERSLYFGLFYVFIWEGFVGSLPGNIKLVSIRHYLRSIGKEMLDYGSISIYGDASGIGASLQ
ncbi:MAG: ABC transporter permease, partial [Candidatus Thermoplasmatota archaeon]